MADQLVSRTRGGAVIAAVVAAAAFWAQANLSGFEGRTATDGAFSSVFMTLIVASPFILAFLLAPTVHGQRWTQWLLVAVIVGAAAWTVLLARQPVPPQGRDGIIFLVVPVVQCAAVLAVGAASAIHRSRTRT